MPLPLWSASEALIVKRNCPAFRFHDSNSMPVWYKVARQAGLRGKIDETKRTDLLLSAPKLLVLI